MLLNISPHSHQTLQEQIIDQIRARIFRGELAPDDPLTSIRGLAKNLRVGVNTVQKAYEQLLNEKLIYSRSGKGFFVAPLEPADFAAIARQRFRDSLAHLIVEGCQSGLSVGEMRNIFDQLRAGTGNGNA